MPSLSTRALLYVLALCSSANGLSSPVSTSTKTVGLSSLKGVEVQSVKTGSDVNLLEDFFGSSDERCMMIFGTYAADFNCIEYGQRLRYYLPKLREECGISKFGFIVNAKPEAAKVMLDDIDLVTDATTTSDDDDIYVQLFVDPSGKAGKAFGCGRGWLPENEDVNPFLKLFGMLWGLGAWATLPAVIGGYIGNPFVPQPWIEDALAVGQNKKRWPDNALEISATDGSITNKFDELPYVGEWPRRPLELATLRLQSMMGISIKKWKELVPDDDALSEGVLTQLGGCVVVDSATGESIYEWKDPGICAVANFEDILKKVKKETK